MSFKSFSKFLGLQKKRDYCEVVSQGKSSCADLFAAPKDTCPVSAKSAISLAIQEEYQRNTEMCKEITILQSITSNLLSELDSQARDAIKQQTIQALESDLEIHAILMQDINLVQGPVHIPLKYNKLQIVISGAKQYLNEHFEDIVHNNTYWDRKDVVNFDDYDFLGTSAANFAQTAMLRLLSSITDAKHLNEISELASAGIYNINTSPNIQATHLLSSCDATYLKDWFFFYKDHQSPIYGELLTPHLGYILGGSRYDERYQNKAFKAEDCSSALSKWLGLEKAFTTYDLALAHQDSDQLQQARKDLILKKLKPITKAEMQVGDIFVVRTDQYNGHTGIITNIVDEDEITILSYTRSMPEKEGLGYNNVLFDDGHSYYFFAEA